LAHGKKRKEGWRDLPIGRAAGHQTYPDITIQCHLLLITDGQLPTSLTRILQRCWQIDRHPLPRGEPRSFSTRGATAADGAVVDQDGVSECTLAADASNAYSPEQKSLHAQVPPAQCTAGLLLRQCRNTVNRRGKSVAEHLAADPDRFRLSCSDHPVKGR